MDTSDAALQGGQPDTRPMLYDQYGHGQQKTLG